MSSVQRGPDSQFPPQRASPPSLPGPLPCPVWVCVVLFLHTVPSGVLEEPTRSRGRAMRCHGCPDGHRDKEGHSQAGRRENEMSLLIPAPSVPVMPGVVPPKGRLRVRRGAGGPASLPFHGLTCGQHHGQRAPPPLAGGDSLHPTLQVGGTCLPTATHRATLGLCPKQL